MARYVIGIDAGGTMTKAALFDFSGQEIACARSRNVMSFPRPGWTERDADAMWRAAASAIGQVLEGAGADPADVLAVSLSGYGSGLYLLDRNGDPVRPGIVSTDSRAADLVAEWTAAGLGEMVGPLVQQGFWPGQSLALLGWLQRHEPDVVERTWRISFCKDFLRGRLCGDLSTDYTDAGSSGLMDVATGAWSHDALRCLGMECWIPKLPEVGRSDEVVGRVTDRAAAETGLRAGTPVVRGTVDMSASALASDLARPDQMNVIAGTFSIAATLHDGAPKTRPLPMLQFPYPRGGWMSVQGSATSASNLEWVVNTVLAHGGALTPETMGDPYATVNAAVHRAMGRPSDTLFLPYLFGGPDGAPAGLVGMTAQNTFDDLMLAVFEGIVFAHKCDIDIALSGPDAAEPHVIRLTGGASRSPVWSELFADILGLPVEVPVGSEFGAKGVAICAAAAAGAYDSLDQAVAAMTGMARRHEVDDERALAHRAKYPRFRALATALAAARADAAGPAAAAPAAAEPAHA